MKKLMVLPVAIAAALFMSPAAQACGDDAKACAVCATKAEAPAKKTQLKGEAKTETFSVTGLKCENCVNGVTAALGNLEGVNAVKVDLKTNTATVTYVKGHVDLEKLNGALKGHFKLSAKEAPAAPKHEHKHGDHH